MRPLRIEKKKKEKCILCKSQCVDAVPKVIFKVGPDYSGRITRSITKMLDYISDFNIVEIYRCMPLLGDEELLPNWEVHIVRYAIVFTNH